ncbi:MAG: glutathione S-transferase family protein [Hyphomonas sp.]|nr:glutathione S-transferase family protein [Hyphomonas sp.]
MIKLTVYPASFEEPTASPFCMKSICMLHAAGLPYEIIETGDPRGAPKQKLPFIEVDSLRIPDSEEIRAFIETAADLDFDEGLTERERGISRSIIRMVEEHVYFAIVADRWGEDDNWEHVRRAFFSDIPAIIRGFVTRQIRKQALAQLNGQGMGRHSAEERFDRVRRDMIAIREILGDKPFLFGENPTGADYSVVPMLRASIVTPVTKPLGAFIKSDPTLMGYVTRGTDRLYPTGV